MTPAKARPGPVLPGLMVMIICKPHLLGVAEITLSRTTAGWPTRSTCSANDLLPVLNRHAGVLYRIAK